MNAARGTRRPHARRPRKKPVKLTRRGGGGGGIWPCLVWLPVIALAAYGLTWLAVGAGLLLSRGLATLLAMGP